LVARRRLRGRDDLTGGLRRPAGCTSVGCRVVKGHFDVLVVAPLVLQCLTGQDDPVSYGERRLDDGPRPEQPRKHDAGLGSVHGNLGA
jgi:hypothetical protein